MKKKMNRVLALLLAGSMVIGMTGCGSSKDADTIKIGGVYPLTGDVPAIGASMENCVKMAIEEANEAGGVLGKQVELVSEDDQDAPAVASNAITKLIEEDQVDIVLGSFASSCSISMATIAKDNQMPMICIGSVNKNVTLEGGGYVYRACFTDEMLGKVSAQFAMERLNATKVAMLYDMSQDFCIGISEVFRNYFEEHGGTVVYEKTYNKGESDFKAYLTELSSMDFDVLYLPDNYPTAGLIVKQAREMGIDCDILGTDAWADKGLIDVAGDAVEGCYFPDHVALNVEDEKIQNFVKKYEEKYGSEPNAFGVLAYDATLIALEAIENAGSTDSEKIVEALKATDMEGLSSHYSFDENGDAIKSVVIEKVENGAFVFDSAIEPEE